MPPKKNKTTVVPEVAPQKEIGTSLPKNKTLTESDSEDELDGNEKVEDIEELEDDAEDDAEDDVEDEDNEIDVETTRDAGDDGEGDECVYNGIGRRSGKNGINKITSNIDRDDEEDEDIIRNNIGEIVPTDQRITLPYLTKYEMVRIIGDRTVQLTLGAKPMIRNTSGLKPRAIAQLELEAHMIPIKIIRPLPDGRREIWSLRELIIKKQYIKYGNKNS